MQRECQTPQIRGTVSNKIDLTSDTCHKFGSPQATCTSDQLAINPEIPMTPLSFDNLVEQLTELGNVLSL